MYEKYPKGGKTTHKSFGTEKGADFIPGARAEGYAQVGSGTSYPGKSSNTAASGYKFKSKGGSFAKAGGSSLVSASYPAKKHQDGFGTKVK